MTRDRDMTGELQHPSLGNVHVVMRSNSRHVSARWKNGQVSLNVPYGVRVSDIHRILNELSPRLLANRPELAYYPGQELFFPYADFVIRTQCLLPSKILAKASVPVSYIEVGSDWNFEHSSTTRAISDTLCSLALRIAPQILIPRAKKLADIVGRHPVGWSISRGHRILGRCTAQGVISLSYVLVFLPKDLSDYVIYHELAHLSEMNHSPRFHALLDSYLGGREEALVKQLRRYSWPVLRK